MGLRMRDNRTHRAARNRRRRDQRAEAKAKTHTPATPPAAPTKEVRYSEVAGPDRGTPFVVDRDVPVDQTMPRAETVSAEFRSSAPPTPNGSGGGTTAPPVKDSALAQEIKKFEAVGQDTRRQQVRSVIHEMLGDGSLISGLTRAIEGQARELAQPDRRYEGEKLQQDAQVGRNVRGGVSAVPPPKVLRHQEFFDILDVEIERVSALVAGLEDRTAFLQFNGPTEAHNEASGTQPSPGPINELEQRIYDRYNRVSVIRHRLEQLHDALRI